MRGAYESDEHKRRYEDLWNRLEATGYLRSRYEEYRHLAAAPGAISSLDDLTLFVVIYDSVARAGDMPSQ